ncbi:MAG: FtsX-like permease family protein, partial [Micrococcales bacterium]|nr:FtsX-like permease family protein [Micrococcales bacterium]
NREWDIPGLRAVAYRDEAVTGVAIYGDILGLVSVVVVAVTAAVVVLVLFLVLSMAILRGRRGFGIQRAVGFTMGQLVAQVVTTYLPVVVGGAVVGGALGHLAFPSLIDVVFQTLAVHVSSMHASVVTTGLLVVAIVVLAAVVATLVATKVRKSSVRSLITE